MKVCPKTSLDEGGFDFGVGFFSTLTRDALHQSENLCKVATLTSISGSWINSPVITSRVGCRYDRVDTAVKAGRAVFLATWRDNEREQAPMERREAIVMIRKEKEQTREEECFDDKTTSSRKSHSVSA